MMADPSSRVLLSILAVSVVLRAVAALVLGDQVVDLPATNDQLSYHHLAVRVLDGYGFSFGEDWWPFTHANAPTAHWSYLYTLYLVAVYAISGVHPLAARLIQAIAVGILHPYFVYRIGEIVFGPDPDAGDPKQLKTVPLLAAAITALYAYFIYYAGALMTEPFYITAVLAALYMTLLLTRTNHDTVRLGLALGLAMAIATLLRQLVLSLVPFLVLWFIYVTYKQKRWQQLARSTAIALTVLALAILPFTLLNYARFGRFVLLNTNAGYAFFWANHPFYGTNFISILPPGGPSYQDMVPAELRSLDEASMEQALLKLGIQFVVDDPVRYALLSVSRIKSYFKFWPDPESGAISNLARVGSFGLFVPFMLYGLLRSFKRQNLNSVWLLYWFMAGYAAIHLLSWALIRYRLPIDAVLVLFAAYGLADLLHRGQSIVSRWSHAQHT
jgi:4-amino-4-deoxy-L-arabinose transferase-like glycosyltransferase